MMRESFKPWTGSDTFVGPVTDDKFVELKHRDGSFTTATQAAGVIWKHYNAPHDIVKYREVPTANG